MDKPIKAVLMKAIPIPNRTRKSEQGTVTSMLLLATSLQISALSSLVAVFLIPLSLMISRLPERRMTESISKSVTTARRPNPVKEVNGIRKATNASKPKAERIEPLARTVIAILRLNPYRKRR